VSERRKLEEERARASAALAESDRRKSEFLAVVSHELRNPLAPIRNAVYILEHADPEAEPAARARAVIKRQTEQLTRLVDDLLDVTRIERGKIELRRSRVDLREIVLHAADDFRFLLENRGVRFHIDLPDAAIWANADSARVTQLVSNLLHNAAKFTRQGDEVGLTMKAAGDVAEVSVRDTGAGIDALLLPKLFEPFSQGDRSLARTEGGLGLGLALVRGIAELHGGTVRVFSEGVGKGAEFLIRIPVMASTTTKREPYPDAIASPPGRRILVVEDNADSAETLAEILWMLGNEVDVALDGPSAIEKARAMKPDVVMCDIGLPRMNGYEVARALRAMNPGALLVAVSGYTLPDDVRRAIEAGFDGHLRKPVDPVAIERLLRS
jgi:CheY-like chemotaxis protein/nitrogen-specific signal transduction histidine kinase